MLSSQVPYLAKGNMPDCNNGLGGDSNSGHNLANNTYSNLTQIMVLPRLFQFCVRWSYICSGLLLMLFWQVPYLAKDHKPDFSNGPGGYSNKGCILAPGVYSSPTILYAIPILNYKHKSAEKQF